eukprot:symbB.v1.2.023035.t1/scaffold2069.1/size90699/2
MAAGFQMSSTTRPTLTSSFCAGLTAIASAARVRRVRPIAERLAALIQELPREVRCRVVSERLEEWQRKQLEQLLLRKLKEPQGSKTSTKLAATVIKPSKMGSVRPPKRVARRKARCANLRVSHGIFRRQTRGGEKFRASISFCNLRLQARPRSCMEDAEQDLEFLVRVRQQVLEEHDDFEDCVRGVLCSPEMSSDAVASRHITLQVTSTGLCSQVLRSPVYNLSQLDAALAAWRKLREARRFGLKPTTLGSLEIDVILDSGERDVAYCVNPGRMEAFTRPDAQIWLSPAESSKTRSLKWTWELIEDKGVLCGTNTQRPNGIIAELLRRRLLPGLDDWLEMKSEKQLKHPTATHFSDADVGSTPEASPKKKRKRAESDRTATNFSDADVGSTPEASPKKKRKRAESDRTTSRLDFWLRSPKGDHYIEAKNCHMVYPDGHGYFPDSVSSRASRHVKELETLVKDGAQCTVIFVVQRGDLRGNVRPSAHHDPKFAEACRHAAAAGVHFRAVLVSCSLSGLTVEREVNVDLEEYDLRPISAWVAENRDSTGWIRSASQQRVANGPFPHEKVPQRSRRSKNAFPIALKEQDCCFDLSKQRRRLPPELCDSWKQLRRAHQDLWQKAGKTGQVQKVLERVEHLAEAQVQAGWERWNRVRMAAEEQLVRRQRRREWQELNRMRHEDAASRRFFRHQMREASREAEILRRIDSLLSKWSF